MDCNENQDIIKKLEKGASKETGRVACCGDCGTQSNLLLWYGDDGYGWPYLETIRCRKCPKPDNIWIDMSRAYNPNEDDKTFGIKDYTISYGYIIYRGSSDVTGICFYCGCEFNAGKGYGHVYIPDELWELFDGRNTTCIIFCKNCYPDRCKNRLSIDEKYPKLSDYDRRVFHDNLREYFKMTDSNGMKRLNS